MNIQLIRHATLGIEYAGVRFLVDPMFSEAGVNPPIINTENDRRNPLVPLPGKVDAWFAPDAILVTHLHGDHWDAAASESLSKPVPLFCQPGDQETFRTAGFQSVIEITEASVAYNGVTLTRTGGQHGTGEIGQRMGKVSGFVLQAEGHPTVYIAGDTIWCDEVREALDRYKPDLTIVNAGGARFVIGDPITMDADDVAAVCRYAPHTQVAAVHMDAINHCLVTRQQLRERLAAEQLLENVLIPEDGEWFGGR
ncbi:MBL fold metallo-hydrolase [Paenibacillus sp. MMS18-CY102]|uniref:MBL fold metallo-hydrolase n=1 Tax=Paenibacillus sp. MMS18-CY102 TaxID=2682849 RepID=UPI00136546D6|nr:MBL fold metallo-hydrolase [Paenibacillus sp. MMS18-CY102]MWC29687.1 MBL fold metallo-hydrolase [Paenibacillus sp. MMS18-CY102]